MPFLTRELIRQALLIAARDECGLATRDTTLREELPAGTTPESAPFELFAERLEDGLQYVLSRQGGDRPDEPLWDWMVEANSQAPEAIIDLTQEAEWFSRVEFVDLLTQLGASAAAPAARPSAAVPPAAEEHLWEWHEIAVFGGLRSIHAEIKANGESPELIAGLAIGYANLALLAEYHMSPAHNAFLARALLYAERLSQMTRASSWALWHRAYVRGAALLHNAARDDIAAAKQKQATATPADLPFWCGVLENFCEGRLTQMVSQAQTLPEQRLAAILNLAAAMCSDNNDVKQTHAHAVLEIVPGCFRAVDALCTTNSLDVKGSVTAVSFERFGTSLRERLPQVPGLPEGFAERIADTPFSDSMAEEVEFRSQVIRELAEAALPETDRGEPSLGALSRLIGEMEFKQLLRRVEFEQNSLGVPAEDTVVSQRRLVERHPYATYIEAFRDHPDDRRAAATALMDEIDITEVSYMEFGMLDWIWRHNQIRGTLFRNVASLHANPLLRDQAHGIPLGMANTPDNHRINGPYMARMLRGCDNLPVAIAYRISRQWDDAARRAPEYRKRYADDPIVMQALIAKYFELEQYADAEACANELIAAAPTREAYQWLASVYEAQNRMDEWKSTLETAMELPSFGLENARLNDKLAWYHIGRKEYDEAVVYADVAATSYAEWALWTSARCHELLGHWEIAEQLVRAIAERYQSSSCDWFLWCQRTGRGDDEAAAMHAVRRIEWLGPENAFAWKMKGIYYLLQEQRDKALEAFTQAYDLDLVAFNAMHAGLLADALGQISQRDTLLLRLSLAPKDLTTEQGVLSKLAGLMLEELAKPEVHQLDLAQVDAAIERAAPYVGKPTGEYFVAAFLQNRGRDAEAEQYFTRAARSDEFKMYNNILACATLRKLGIPLAAPSESPSPGREPVEAPRG